MGRKVRWKTGLTALVMAATTTAPAAADTLQLRMATSTPDGSPWMRILDKGAAEIAARTDKRVNVKWYASGVQGDERTATVFSKAELDMVLRYRAEYRAKSPATSLAATAS